MKNIVISILIVFFGLIASDFIPLVDFLQQHTAILTNEFVFLPCLFVLILSVIFHNYHIATYTDEFMPFKLSVVSLIMVIVGLFVFVRILILGIIALLLSSFWSRKTVQQYFPKKRRVKPTSTNN